MASRRSHKTAVVQVVKRSRNGKVLYFIPPPVPLDPKMQPPIGIVVDGQGAIYAASDDQKDIKKYVKN